MKRLVADDHPMVHDAITALLQRMGPTTVVLAARDGAECLRIVREQPDVDAVFLDLRMPGARWRFLSVRSVGPPATKKTKAAWTMRTASASTGASVSA